jgi:hypothetical protein
VTSIASLKLEDIVLASVILLLAFLLFHRYWRSEPESSLSDGTLGVADLIEKVKSDLETVDRQRIERDEAPLFNVDSFDLEINFVVKEGQSTSAQGEYKVLTVGGTSEVSSEKVQKIVLHLKAVEMGQERSVKADAEENEQ